MTRHVKPDVRCLAKLTTAAIALVASGYLATSGSRAEPATAEGSNPVSQNETWVGKTVVVPADTSARAANETWVQKSYAGGPKSDEDYEPVPADDGKEGKANKDSKDSKDSKPKPPSKSADAAAKQDKLVQKSFRPGPQYDTKYDAQDQVDIYGAKKAVEPPRPLLEVGREQYTSGLYDQSGTLLGQLNPLLPGLAIYGDWRTAIAYNSNGGKDIAQIATRLNLDVDLKLTGTERIHAFFTPLQDNNRFTRYEFGGGQADDKFNGEFDFEPQTLFFEGDVGSLYSGFSGQQASFDLPFTVGLFPLFLQNGIWANDAILGGAVTLPAKNSAALGLSNFDTTFFAAFDNVDNASLLKADGKIDRHGANLFGVTTFIDAFGGYVEAGYGFIQGTGDQDGVQEHFLTAAYSRRYANTISNSTRAFANFGDNNRDNADGFAIISENSLISGLPSTLIPYANFFVGVGNPQPLVDGNNSGILKNVGINFETDALTGYPKMDDTASNTVGGAIGLQYLFNLDQQLVFEVATVQPFEQDGIGVDRPQYGFGVRYQIPLDRAWLFRADATYQIIDGGDDNFGFRTEVRRKF